jgi:hypothetical protein
MTSAISPPRGAELQPQGPRTADAGSRIANRVEERFGLRYRFDRAKHALSKAEGNPKLITKNIRTLRVLPELRGKN